MARLLLSVVVVQLLVLWALRPLVWWYFGIHRVVRAVENIDASLRVLPVVERDPALANRRPARAA